jgi:hypothetical protein
VTRIERSQADNADLIITINRSDLVFAMVGAVSFDEQTASGKATFVGNREDMSSSRRCWCILTFALRSCPEPVTKSGTGGKPLQAV